MSNAASNINVQAILDAGILGELVAGDRVRVTLPGAKRARVLEVLKAPDVHHDGRTIVFVSSGRVRPGHISGGMLEYNPRNYGAHIMYQPTMLQQIRPVARVERV